MEPITVHWKDGALDDFVRISEWYHTYQSVKAATKFIKNIQHSVELLSLNPQMGHTEELLGEQLSYYRSFVTHPYYKILYYIEDENKILYIAAIWDCRHDVASMSHSVNR